MTSDKLGCRECVSCKSSASAEWRSISASGLKILEKYKRERKLKPGEAIHNQGDPSDGIYCLREGLMGERRLDCEGRSILVRLHHPGAIFGYRETLSEIPYANSVEALRESCVCFIGRSIFRELMDCYPGLSGKFLRRSMSDCRQLEDKLVEARTYDVKHRFLQVLLELYKRSGVADECDEHVLDIPVSRRDLAELVGTSPETLSRTVRQLEREGLMQFNGQRVYFLSLASVSKGLHGRPV